MSPLARGLVLALAHALLVASLGGKLLYDRATRPRVWVRTAPVDPDALFRGRYVQLRLEVQAAEPLPNGADVTLSVEGERLVAHLAAKPTQVSVVPGRGAAYALAEPVAFFIPEHVEDPSRRKRGEELWAEVTVPKRGPPRPIRLGVRTKGAIEPLEF